VTTTAPSTEVLQEEINVLAWLHAEQRFEYMELVARVVNVGRAIAGVLAQNQMPQIQQQVQEQILDQLMTGGVVVKPPSL
jgi:hypothetical protein